MGSIHRTTPGADVPRASKVTVACCPTFSFAASVSEKFAETCRSFSLLITTKPEVPEVVALPEDPDPAAWPTLPLTSTTVPPIGARRVVSERVSCACATCACAEVTWASAWVTCPSADVTEACDCATWDLADATFASASAICWPVAVPDDLRAWRSICAAFRFACAETNPDRAAVTPASADVTLALAEVALASAVCRSACALVGSSCARTWPLWTTSPTSTEIDATVPDEAKLTSDVVVLSVVPDAETVASTVPR